MNLQINEKHWKLVIKILRNYSHKANFEFFGSRVTHQARVLSDLDILVSGEISKYELESLIEAFEESDLPFKVDIVTKENISDDFFQHIAKDLVAVKFDKQ